MRIGKEYKWSYIIDKLTPCNEYETYGEYVLGYHAKRIVTDKSIYWFILSGSNYSSNYYTLVYRRKI